MKHFISIQSSTLVSPAKNPERCFSITRACPPVLKYFIWHTSSSAY